MIALSKFFKLARGLLFLIIWANFLIHEEGLSLFSSFIEKLAQLIRNHKPLANLKNFESAIMVGHTVVCLTNAG